MRGVTAARYSLSVVVLRVIVLGVIVMLGSAFGLTTAVGHAQANAQAASLKNPVKPTPDSIAKGRATFNKACRHCHGASGVGDGPLAPKNPPPANLTDATWDHGSSDGEIFTTITSGVGGKSEMKGFKSELTPTDVWNIVNFLRSIGPKS